MDTTTFFLLYAISVPVFFVIDMLWLGWLARDFYQRQIGHLLGEVNWVAAIVFYCVYLVGMVYFAMYPAYLAGDVLYAFLVGGAFGFFTYATYDMTNLATLRSWPTRVTYIDIMWGTTLGALVSGTTVWLALSLLTG